MKKSLFIVLVIISIFIISATSRAQVHISLGPQLGMAIPMSDYSGGVTDFYYGNKYGLKGGFNFGATFKAELLVIAGRIDINYAMFSNSGSITGFNNASATVKQNNLIVGIGPEFSFDIPFTPFKPYGGVELLFTSFTGESQFQGTPGVNSNNNSLSSASRMGVGLLLGNEFKLGMYYMDFSLRYNMLNLTGKSFTTYNNNDMTNSYLNLNDDRDPNYDGDKHPIGISRNISTLQINVGILFGL